jgi:tetratricopeptide (TPR) repeat protein
MREFPEILKKLGSIPPFSPEDRKAFLAEYEKMVGFALPKEPAFGSNYPEFEAQNKREERQLAELQLKMLKMYLEVCPDDVDALVETAARYAILLENYPGQEEYLEECEALLERALELSPDDLRVLARAYRIYEDVWRCSSGEKRRQLLNKLIELLRKRCEINPTDSFPWIQLSRIYEMYIVTEDRGRDLEEAIRCMEEATKRDCSWRCWQKLGELYLRKGDRERMLECYSKAFEKYVKEKQVNEF